MTSLQQQQQQAALERAKAIAAKLSSTVDSANKKRKWGDIVAGSNSTSSGATATAMAGVEPKRIWIRPTGGAASSKPLRHFALFLKEPLAALTQKYAGGSSAAEFEIKMELKGRGSTDKPPLPGIPEEPLHVLLYAPRTLLTQIEAEVDDLIAAAEHAPMEEGAEEWERTRAAMYGHNSTGSSVLALTAGAANGNNGASSTLNSTIANNATPRSGTTTTTTTTAYRPASVAQLIGQANLPMEAQYLQLNSVQQEEQMQVPNSLVGYIIGRGGENIASMQARTGARVQIQKEHELVPGQTHRVITVSGPTTEAVEKCKTIIQGLVQERMRSSGSAFDGGQQQQQQNALFALEIDVPDADVGLIIGKMGSTIKSIQEETGANIQIPQSAAANSQGDSSVLVRTVKITHATSEQGAAMAKQRIMDIMQQRSNKAGGGSMLGGKQTSIQISIPDKDVGLCIGRQGCVIRHMQSTTNTRIQIPQHPLPGEAFRIATVTGPEEGCKRVQQMIQSIIVEQSSASVMSGTYGAQEQCYSGQAAVAGQEAYSADWAAYHAAQAAAAAAAQQQQQQQHATASSYSNATAANAYYGATQQQQQYQTAASTNTASTATAADTYHEPFFRYAYYYGEEAARQYYGAWSPPPGTPNPYGINPNGIQAAPAVENSSAVGTADSATYTTTAATALGESTAANVQVTASYHSTGTMAPDNAQPVSASPSSNSLQAAAASNLQARETGRRKVSNLPAWMTKK